MPDLIADAFDCLGEEMSDWLTLEPVAPLYRSFFPDGSVLDVHSDVDQMADEIDRRLALQAKGSMNPFAVIDARTGRAVGMTTYMNIDATHQRVEAYRWR